FRKKIKRRPITLENARAIADECDLCEKVSPRTFTSATVKYGNNALKQVGIMGGEASFIDIVDIEVAEGRYSSHEDDLYKRPVAFIGDKIREVFFSGVDPIGKTIKINGSKYRVIGVAKRRGEMFGQSQDNFVVIPLSRFLKQFGLSFRRGLNIAIKARSIEELDQAMDQVRVILRAQRHVPYNQDDDFDMLTADSALDALNAFTRIARMGLIGISSIALVVGAIVVMNIMMVAVSERTREIGIRKSLGARRSDILLQFMFEALMVTFGGGFLGVVLGYLIARVLVGMIGMQISPSMLAVALGLFISSATGLISGVYPAMKAAGLDPVRALSYE
ncbi:MAG: FtsX-like permease family protein, partial [Candidatus Zixiibacteriota bacterium]